MPDWDDAKAPVIGLVIALVIVGLLLLIILLAVSFAVISPTQMGLLYDASSKHIDRERLYMAGRHYVGVGKSFIKFPRTVETIALNDVNGRTSDGLPVNMDLSFNYKLTTDLKKICVCYELFGVNYVTVMKKVATNLVRDVAARYSAFSFYFNRSSISVAMDLSLSEALDVFGFSIDGFQLLNFELPKDFSNAIVATQVVREQITQAQYEQQSAQVEASTRIAEAKRTADMIVVTAQADASATISAMNSQAQALTFSLRLEAQAYKALIDNLNMTTSEFVSWVWLDAIDAPQAQQSIAVSLPKL
jgi:regulator of protease activity HflC (stomatin/prohibitin superfamily)